jgi:hypothetical protein
MTKITREQVEAALWILTPATYPSEQSRPCVPAFGTIRAYIAQQDERIRELEAGITDALTALRGAGTGMSGDRILSGVEAMLMAEAALSKALAGGKETP